MAVSYVLDRDELIFLFQLCGFTPLTCLGETPGDGQDSAQSLSEKGFITLLGTEVLIDRTMRFMVETMGDAELELSMEGTQFWCLTAKLAIFLKKDEHSQSKFILSPIGSITRLQHQLAEAADEASEPIFQLSSPQKEVCRVSAEEAFRQVLGIFSLEAEE